MITESRQSRTRLLQYEYRRRHRRRHHTLDNTTLDKFNFVCIPLRPDESRTDPSSFRSHSTMVQRTDYSGSTSSVHLHPTARRVRFKCDDTGVNQHRVTLMNHRHAVSSEDIRLTPKRSTHRVEFQIPIHRDTHPWLHVDVSSPAKTRSLTSQKIDIKPSAQNSIRVHRIPSFVEVDTTVHPPPMGNDAERHQSQWYKQVYGTLHKPPASKLDRQPNPYQPTYAFPNEFHGDSDSMEDYIRKTATQSIDKDNRKVSFSPARKLTSSLKDHRTASKRANGHIEKVTRFDDRHMSPVNSASTERHKPESHASSSSVNITPQSNSNHMSTSDNEQKVIYKRILRTNDLPANHLQKGLHNDRDKSNHHTNGHAEQQTWVSRHDATDSSRQRPEQRTPVQSSLRPIYKALALHSFYAQTSRELSFKKGDILLVRRRINDDWLEGEFQDSVGIFPLNHVELFPLEANEQENVSSEYELEHEDEGEAIVKYDFVPQKTFELQLRKGDKVTLLRRLDENWYEGRLNHIEGIFPAAYVETLKEPPDNHSHIPQQVEHVQSPKRDSPPSEPAPSEPPKTPPESSPTLRKCQVLYDYTPQNPDELEIHVGDIINIIEMCDDGWYCGMMETPKQGDTMEFGTFPGNYVKLLP